MNDADLGRLALEEARAMLAARRARDFGTPLERRQAEHAWKLKRLEYQTALRIRLRQTTPREAK